MTKVASARKTGSDRESDDGFDDLSDSTAPPTGSNAKLLDKLQRDARTFLRQKQGVKKQLDNSLELASDKPSPFVRDQVYTLFTVGSVVSNIRRLSEIFVGKSIFTPLESL